MNAITHTAQHLASQQAAQLSRENEIRRSRAERGTATGYPAHLTGLAAIMARFTKSPRVAPRRTAAVATAR